MKALIIVDVQYDFCPGGALPVKGGDKIIDVINGIIPKFQFIATTQDWHPKDHCSFSSDPKFVDKSWPPHCIAGSDGARIHLGLRIGNGLAYGTQHMFVHKGSEQDVEQYSGFQGYICDWRKEIYGAKYDLKDSLEFRLRQYEVKDAYICGLATDYCVKATALDSIKHGFNTFVIFDACEAVDPNGSGLAATEEMKAAGVKFILSSEVA